MSEVRYDYDTNKFITWVPEYPVYPYTVILTDKDCEYDGLLDGHNDDYFVTLAYEIWDESTPDKHSANNERVFYMHKVDKVTERLIRVLDSDANWNVKFDIIMALREYYRDKVPEYLMMEDYVLVGWCCKIGEKRGIWSAERLEQ